MAHEAAASGASLVQEAERLLAQITPTGDEHTKLCRYDHGGGRLYREAPNPNRRTVYAGGTDRTLIADFYHEGDREFYTAAPRLVRELLSALEQASSRGPQWQPMETAPKDGTIVLGFEPGEDNPIDIMRWKDGAWRDPDTWRVEPTHWMPLPSPPVASSPETEGKE